MACNADSPSCKLLASYLNPPLVYPAGIIIAALAYAILHAYKYI